MAKRTLIIAALATSVLAATAATPASAGDPVLGALVGGGIGAAIGNSVNGRNGAWVGGAIGAVTGASIAAGSGYHNDGGYYGPPAAYPAPGYGATVTYGTPYYAPPVVVRPRPFYGRPYPAYGLRYGYRWDDRHGDWRAHDRHNGAYGSDRWRN